jgi:hypothetical protein
MLLSHALRAALPYPFTIYGTNTIGTDFSRYPLGTPSDWQPIGSAGTTVASIISGGAISSKCLQIAQTAPSSFERVKYGWNSSRSVATDNQEILMLVEIISGAGIPSNSATNVTFGPLLKTSINNNYIGAGPTINGSNVTPRFGTGRVNAKDSDFAGGTASGANPTGVKYWVRVRLTASAVHNRKVWIYGTAEPAAFTTFTVPTNTWPTAAGVAGLTAIESGSTTHNFKVHFVSVAYDSTTAPFP